MKKILVAEDDRALLKLVETVLSDAGYVVKTASDGAMALRYVKEFKPDLLLLDIMMPVVDGYHICRILSEDMQYSPVPKIIVVTIRKEDWDKRISRFGGADAFISKPFNTGELLKKIRELLKDDKNTDS